MSMSLNSGGRENHEDVVETSGLEITDKEADLNIPVNEMKGLSLTVNDDIEEQTDEGDGLLKKLGTLACVVGKKKVKGKEEIEPFSTNQESWIYSNLASDIAEAEAENVSSNITGTHIKHSPRQKQNIDSTESDCYKFTYPKRGYLLLVINEKFYNQASRKGADLDLLKMKKVAKKIGFQTLNKGAETNLTKAETMNWLLKAQDTDHSTSDCFMFMISTHGLEQQNPRKGGLVDHALVCADDQLIFTSTIIEMFSETNCPSLKGKPKIFIIQACRGTSVDHGSDMTISNHKGKPDSTVRDRKAKHDNPMHLQSDVSDTKGGQDSWVMNTPRDIDTPCLKCDADMLVMYAIPPGMLAWRNTADGSWMIHYLYEILMAYDLKAPKSFLNILTKVSARMALRSTDTPSIPEIHEKKAIPVIEHMLTRDILFSLKL
ncbi:caspase-3-like [Mercenaria mercenaria]|uniref:caspase-3-like n=1 Tax=Mercenaria mercenaria TaxID=6596 RepID=UPI00234F68C0|nr:caspase-3-like [Mercenaria mercenaria]